MGHPGDIPHWMRLLYDFHVAQMAIKHSVFAGSLILSHGYLICEEKMFISYTDPR